MSPKVIVYNKYLVALNSLSNISDLIYKFLCIFLVKYKEGLNI